MQSFPTHTPVKPETWELIVALLQRADLWDAAHKAFKKRFPDAPQEMIDAAAYHVFTDGIGAALEWVASTEQFLRDPTKGIDYGTTAHLLYHLYNWQQFEALLPIGRSGVVERLEDMKQFLAEGNTQAAERVRQTLEEMFKADATPPYVG
jgi:hypothetical protein